MFEIGFYLPAINASKTVKAGGPGSGRHKNTISLQMNNKLHDAGFRFSHQTTNANYYKHDNGDKLMIRHGGMWSHRPVGALTPTTGDGQKSLGKHLSTFYKD